MLKSCSWSRFFRQRYAEDDSKVGRVRPARSLGSSLPTDSIYARWPKIIMTALSRQRLFKLKYDLSMNPHEVTLRRCSALSEKKEKEDVSRLTEDEYYALEKRKEQYQLAEIYRSHHLTVRWMVPAKPKSFSGIFATDIGKYVIIRGEIRYIVSNWQRECPRFREPAVSLSQAISQRRKPIIFSGDLDIMGGDIIPVKDIMTSDGTTVLFVGHGVETDDKIPDKLREQGLIVIPIQTLQREFFHLDTFFCPLPSGYALFYPGTAEEPTTDKSSIDLLHQLYPGDRLIEISTREAENFATNCEVFQDRKSKKWIITAPANAMDAHTRNRLCKLGFEIEEVEYSKIQERHGSIRCTTLESPDMQKSQIELVEGSKFLEDYFTERLSPRPDGSFYVGELKEGVPNGKGTLFYSNGEIEYEGGFKDGQPEGMCKFFYFDGGLGYEGEFRDGVRNGKGKSFYSIGKIEYEGEFRDGQPEGMCKFFDFNGNLKYEGEFKDGVRNGNGKLFDIMGKNIHYEGELPHGRGKIFYKNETLVYDGQFVEGEPDGKGKIFYENGELRYEGDVHDSLPYGKGRLFKDNGELDYEGNFEKGVPDSGLMSTS